MKEFPSRGHKLIFGNLARREIEPRNPKDKKKSSYKAKFEIRSENESVDASKAIKRLAAFAFRRPVTDRDLAPYLALFKKEREKKESFEGALRTVFTALFSSPHFLYLREKQGRLDDLALANRLSLFLSRTMPERELLSLAYQGKLTKDPGALRKETERLLKHERFDRFLTDFTESWLDLRDMDFTEPDKKLFPEFDRPLQLFMVEETEEFLRELIDSNLPATNVVKSEFAMLNERLAEHYEVPGVTGIEIRKVKLPAGTPRGGFLSQGSVLKVTANGTNTSPVMRGVWVMERILGITPKPPPPGVPGVEPDIRGTETLRELLAKHRSMENCRGCHAKFDPLGFALESFNPIGGYREHYRSFGNPKADRSPGAAPQCCRIFGPGRAAGTAVPGRVSSVHLVDGLVDPGLPVGVFGRLVGLGFPGQSSAAGRGCGLGRAGSGDGVGGALAGHRLHGPGPPGRIVSGTGRIALGPGGPLGTGDRAGTFW